MISADELTAWLCASGALPAGAVTRVHVDLEVPTTVSMLRFLRLEYSPDAPHLPGNVVVKQPLGPSTEPNVVPSELDFYRRLAPAMRSPPILRCLAAVDGEADRLETLVLEDLRATYHHRPWPLPPTRAQSDAAIEAFATVHARWWEHAELGRSIGSPHSVESLTTMVSGFAALVPRFLDDVGDGIASEVRRLYERVFSSSLRPWLRLTDPRALTVIHGDAHSGNILFPRSGDGPAMIIDWQLWHVDVGARDLAFLIALHWYPERRREMEVPTLRRYHDQLVARGVERYAFDDLMLDYRRGAVRNLTFPLALWKRGLAPETWFHRLHCAVAAYRDLGCDELLDAS
jgi:hypothetical protein